MQRDESDPELLSKAERAIFFADRRTQVA